MKVHIFCEIGKINFKKLIYFYLLFCKLYLETCQFNWNCKHSNSTKFIILLLCNNIVDTVICGELYRKFWTFWGFLAHKRTLFPWNLQNVPEIGVLLWHCPPPPNLLSMEVLMWSRTYIYIIYIIYLDQLYLTPINNVSLA